jgi:rare lipoprotein A
VIARGSSGGVGKEERSVSMRVTLAGVAALSVFLVGCGSTTSTSKTTAQRSKEYFAESEYGVKASPRVAWGESGLPRGGGRYQLGKPYQIKGRWYHPKEDPRYVGEGKASWYGDAFHGRLTANGEVYDMTHLTAAHPTMPLPSYARVTNLKNGHSVMVRVNDRGPFAHDRVIDMSKRAAEMLDYKNDGVARVRVEYVGPAPLHGQDDSFLVASYRPGGAAPDPSDGLPTGVMVAMAGPTPTQPVPSAAAAFASQPAMGASEAVSLPAVGPLLPDKPADLPTDFALLSYADQRVSAASRAFDALMDPALNAEALANWWERRSGAQAISGPYINLGAWQAREQAEGIARSLSEQGKVSVQESAGPHGKLYVLALLPESAEKIDDALQAAWMAGASDAFVVRD